MSLRSALVALGAILAVVALAGPAEAGTTGSGGVLAVPPEQGPGGGGLVPDAVLAEPGEEAADADGGEGPAARAAQEETPTTPEGEEQPDGAPPPDTPTLPGEEPTSPGEEPLAPPEPAPGAEEIAGDDGALGFLPSTGLETGALAAIGLGLLMAGVALRPRRRAPAGRR